MMDSIPLMVVTLEVRLMMMMTMNLNLFDTNDLIMIETFDKTIETNWFLMNDSLMKKIFCAMNENLYSISMNENENRKIVKEFH